MHVSLITVSLSLSLLVIITPAGKLVNADRVVILYVYTSDVGIKVINVHETRKDENIITGYLYLLILCDRQPPPPPPEPVALSASGLLVY